MLRKLFRFFLISLQTVVFCLLVGSGVFLWRLHSAPLNIDRYIPYITKMAAPVDANMKITIETAEMQWGGIRHPIDFNIKNLKIFDAEEKLVVSIPQLSFSFSLSALLRGTISPRTLAIYRPYLNLALNKTGELQQNPEDGEAVTELAFLIDILKHEKHLIEVSLIKAKVKITDAMHNTVWNIPEADLSYSRRSKTNKLDAFVKIALDDMHFQSVTLKGRWKKKSKKIPLTFKAENLDLTRLFPAERSFFKNITTPIDLRLEIRLDSLPLKDTTLSYWRKALDRIDFTIAGGKGIIDLPEPVIARYDLERFTITGALHASADNIDISDFNVTLQNGGTAQGNLSVSGVGGAIDTGNWENIQASLNAKTKNVPMEKLASYWPASLGPDVHDWVKRNLRGGMIDDTTFALHFKGLSGEAGIEPDMVDGWIDVTDTQIVYLDDMPPINEASGRAHLTLNDLLITIKHGVSNGVSAENGGTFSILGMTDPVTTAVLNTDISGNVSDILEILDSPALNFMKAIGIDPKKTTGTAQGNLKLKFPLGDALKSADQIDVKVDATVRNADVENIILGLGIQDAILAVKMDGRDLFLNGTALFYGATAKYKLHQSFDPAAKRMTDINLHVDLNDRARKHLNYAFFTDPAVSGVMPTDLSLVLKPDNTGVLDISADITNLAIDLREIGWNKPEKIPGNVLFKLNLADGKPTAAPLISMTDQNGSKIKGSLKFRKNGKLKNATFSQIKTDRTNAKITVDFSSKNAVSVKLSGTSLDISGLLKKGTSLNIRESESIDDSNDPVHLYMDASIKKLWLSENGFSEQNTISTRYHDGWKKMRFNGLIGEQKVPLKLLMEPTKESGIYTLTLTSEDAGYTLKAFDYISTVKGGRLNLNGVYTVGSGSKGTVSISDFYLEDDKILIQILQLTSFTGILDTLRGEGLFFNQAEIPFTTDNESLIIDSALASGSSLGITLNGKYYHQSGYMNLYGSIIPFYSINSFLGKIPLIGGLFSGEKGGGLIAPTYTVMGKLPSPDVSVNAFSALAPGAFRSIVGKIIREEGDLSQKETVSSPEKKENFKPINPTVQTEIIDEELLHE
ncbi:MAG: AsmA-like C-terminal domain-containing protein [Alphaproteobacteria bacterium]|nr:AsmA-like C-terminal domain-containing protein [Alphaproteobacteria bacterium]